MFYKIPSWAAKFFADAIMALEEENYPKYPG
jgi:hypothetical protein